MVEILKTFTLTPRDALMIAICAFLFIGMWKLLDRVLFAPFQRLLEERERATEGAASSAAELGKSARELQQTYEQQLLAARVDAMKQKLDEIKAAKADAAATIQKAQESAQAALREARQALTGKLDAARRQSTAEADRVAEILVQRVQDQSGVARGA